MVSKLFGIFMSHSLILPSWLPDKILLNDFYIIWILVIPTYFVNSLSVFLIVAELLDIALNIPNMDGSINSGRGK